MQTSLDVLSILPRNILLLLIVLVFILLFSVLIAGVWIIKNKDIKLKNIEVVAQSQKELYRTEGKNTLDNQTSNAHNLLKKVWIDLYETGRKKFNITDKTELFLLENIAHLIEGKLNYEVKNDLTRNHITEKGDLELTQYSDAKATGYYRSVKANLYTYNIQLPDYDLPEILDSIPLDEYKRLFNELYFNARKIAGGVQQ
ncbi:MAG: hypothetical protein J6S85_19730 [Methanobrevibacter sp.]|nr:hypothetical protein [Methanobrevibacter sp.]